MQSLQERELVWIIAWSVSSLCVCVLCVPFVSVRAGASACAYSNWCTPSPWCTRCNGWRSPRRPWFRPPSRRRRKKRRPMPRPASSPAALSTIERSSSSTLSISTLPRRPQLLLRPLLLLPLRLAFPWRRVHRSPTVPPPIPWISKVRPAISEITKKKRTAGYFRLAFLSPLFFLFSFFIFTDPRSTWVPFRLNGPCFLFLFFLFLFLQSSYKSTLALREKTDVRADMCVFGTWLHLEVRLSLFFSVFFSFSFFALVFCPFVGSAVVADQSRSARSKRSQVEEPNKKRNGVAFVSFRLVEHVTFNVYSHRLMLENTKWPLGSFSVLLTHTDTLCARLTMTSTQNLGRPFI